MARLDYLVSFYKREKIDVRKERRKFFLILSAVILVIVALLVILSQLKEEFSFTLHIEESELVHVEVETMRVEGYFIRLPFRLYYVTGSARLGENSYTINDFKHGATDDPEKFWLSIEFRSCRPSATIVQPVYLSGFVHSVSRTFEHVTLHLIDFSTLDSIIVKVQAKEAEGCID